MPARKNRPNKSQSFVSREHALSILSFDTWKGEDEMSPAEARTCHELCNGIYVETCCPGKTRMYRKIKAHFNHPDPSDEV